MSTEHITEFSMKEVASHDKPDDAWMVIHGQGTCYRRSRSLFLDSKESKKLTSS